MNDYIGKCVISDCSSGYMIITSFIFNRSYYFHSEEPSGRMKTKKKVGYSANSTFNILFSNVKWETGDFNLRLPSNFSISSV
jgi:hypothetical protein